jgi:hypothetical protein
MKAIDCRIQGPLPDLSPLFRLDPAAIRTDPFAHAVPTDVLPADEYAALSAEFLSLDVIAPDADGRGSNTAVRMTATSALASDDVSPLWRRFFELHTSTAYWRRLVALFGDHLRTAFPTLEARVGRPFGEWRVARRGSDVEADVRLDCQFVMNTPVTRRSSVKTPHVDKYDKIFSALLYMRAPNDRTPGGDLDLYRWRRAPRFVRHRVLPRDVDLVKTIAYAPNTHVAFVNSSQSVHGVSPRDVTDVPRRYVNFIAEVPLRAFEPRQAGAWHRWWYGRASDDY